jgi:sporulation protein YlmC with PRC-barrel domain
MMTIPQEMPLTEDNLTGVNHGKLYSNQPLKYLTASSIIGDKVQNRKREHLGEIKDIMIDIITGKIEYLVIEFGGFLGIGIKYFAIPFGLFRVDPVNQVFIFNLDRETLEKAPGFDMDHWPETNIHFEQAYSYWSFMG